MPREHAIDRKKPMFYTPAVAFSERRRLLAEVAELADAHDSNSCSFGSVGSIPTFGIGPFLTLKIRIISPGQEPGKLG
jgi:hypothetical protein